MVFKMPVLVYEEKDCVKNHAAELAGLGKKAMIVTGRYSAKENGSLSDVQAALDSQGTAYIVFDGVEENPSVETVMKARTIGIQEQADFVIGIGGGSPMDAAKAIALMIANADKDTAFLDEKGQAAACLPVAAVPTTCGTGSEVTGVSVLTRHDRQTKASIAHKIYPQLALVDAKYLAAAPEQVLRNTAADAFAHLVESYLNTNATDYSRMFVREGLMVWSRSKDIFSGKRKPSMEDFRNMMNASTYAGMAIAHTGTALPHGLSYYVTYELGIAHGKACAYFLAGYVREANPADRKEVLKLAGFADVEEMAAYLDQVCDLAPLPQELLERAAGGIGSNKAKLRNCPYPADIQVLKRIAGLL